MEINFLTKKKMQRIATTRIKNSLALAPLKAESKKKHFKVRETQKVEYK